MSPAAANVGDGALHPTVGKHMVGLCSSWGACDSGWLSYPPWYSSPGPLPPPRRTRAARRLARSHSASTTETATLRGDIYVVRTDGRWVVKKTTTRLAIRRRCVPSDGSRGFRRDPTWGPGGREIAFTRNVYSTTRGNGIWIVHRDGSGARRIAAPNNPYPHEQPNEYHTPTSAPR